MLAGVTVTADVGPDDGVTTEAPVVVTANRAPDPVETLGTIDVIGNVPSSAPPPALHVGKTPSKVTTLAPVTVNAKIPKTKTDCKVADPIDLGTQAKVEAETDFVAPGEMGLKFVRYYNSNAVNETTVGTNLRIGSWTTSYDYILTLDKYQTTNCNYTTTNSTCPLIMVRPDGATVEFTAGTPNADGSASFAELNGGNATMVRNSDGSYTVHDEDSKVLQFSPSVYTQNQSTQYFALISIKDIAGIGWMLSYPDANDMVVTHTSGQTVKLNWSDTVTGFGLFGGTTNRQLTVTDPGGKVYTYATTIPVGTVGNIVGSRYLTGELQSVTFSDKPATVISYKYQSDTSNANGLLGYYQYALTEVDYDGVAHDLTSYNSLGQAVQTVRADGTDKVSIVYATNGTGVAATVTNALGHVSVYQFDGNANIVSVTGQAAAQCDASFSSQTYDANGNVKTQTDSNGNVTTFSYAQNGQLLQKIEATGTPYSRTTNFVWDPTPGADRLSSVTVVGYLQTTFTYTPQGRLNSVTQTNLTSNGVLNQAHQTNYAYTLYPNGMVSSVKITPPDTTNTVTYTYDNSGYLSSITDGLGHTTTYNTHDGLGRVTRMTDMNGVITDFVYTTREWLATKTVRANANGSPSSSDAVTKLFYMNLPYDSVTAITDPDGITTSYTYDSSQRLTRVTDPIGNYIQYTLDAAGNRTKTTIYNASGQITGMASRKFNVLGQLISTFNSNGVQVVTYSYDPNGNLTDAMDANGIDTHIIYDALNRPHNSIQNYNGSDSATANTTTTYNRDALDHLASLTDPSNLTTSYATDAFGQVWTIISPDTGRTSFVYDASGRNTSKTDARGVVNNYTYDAIGRITAIQYPAHPNLNVTYSYDQANPISICAPNFNNGQLTSMTDETGTMAWCYSNLGYINIEQKLLAGGTYNTIITRTPGGRMKNIQHPSLFELNYGFDADGRVNNISYQQNNVTNNGFVIVGSIVPLISSVSYLPFGPLVSYTWAQAGSPTESRSYDGNYLLTDITSPTLNLHFARNITGQITAEGVASGANPASETYQYDPLYRIKEVDGSGAVPELRLTYNLTGDRLSKTVANLAATPYSYTPNTHQLSAVGGSALQNDAMGNVSILTAPNGSQVGLDYDDRGFVDAVTNASATIATYQYNGFGQRVRRSATVPSAIQEKYIYEPDGNSELLGEYLSSGRREFIYLNDIPVAAAINPSPVEVASIQDLYTDQNGTIRNATDSQGNPIYSWQWLNNAFGEQLATGSAGLFNRFPGQSYDPETGLFYNGSRYYDPAIGRYAESDPSGMFGGQNSTYAYVGGDPLGSTDSLGLAPEDKFKSLSDASKDASAYLANLRGGPLQRFFFGDLGIAIFHEVPGCTGEYTYSFVPYMTGTAPVPIRAEALSLAEQLALGEAKAGAGARIMAGRIKDPAFPEDIYAKMEHVHRDLVTGENIVIHYWEELATGIRSGFKFK